MNIKNVVVIGSGTMGSGIAAQLCNADVPEPKTTTFLIFIEPDTI